MVDIAKITSGITFWFSGLFFMYISNIIVPYLIELLSDSTQMGTGAYLLPDDQKLIFYLALLLFYILFTIIIPFWLIKTGLEESPTTTGYLSGSKGKIQIPGEFLGGNKTFGAIWLILALGFFYVSYKFITPLQQAVTINLDGTTDTTLNIIFWISLIIIWATTVIGIPAYLMLKEEPLTLPGEQ